eukprot:12689929-Alexandrium_andersonii.AAC.1
MRDPQLRVIRSNTRTGGGQIRLLGGASSFLPRGIHIVARYASFFRVSLPAVVILSGMVHMPMQS